MDSNDAFLSRLTNALGHSTTLTWDLNIGKPVSIKDPNNQPTGADYTDPLDRLKSVTYPDGGNTAYVYNDPTNTVTETKTINSSATFSQNSVYDGLGRLTQTQLTSDPEGTDYVDTTYDAGGRVYSVSSPHRSAASSTDGTTYHYYDALGRSCVVVPPDGTNLSPGTPCPTTKPAGDVFTTYTGNCSTVTDEAGKERKSCVDGLGRITGVWDLNNAHEERSGRQPRSG